MAYKSGVKNGWSLFFLILSGIVLGGFIGSLVGGLDSFKWLNFGYTFGMDSPLAIDLKVIYFQFKLAFNITIASLLGIAVAIFVYRKI